MSEQSGALIRMWRWWQVQPSQKERAIGEVHCKNDRGDVVATPRLAVHWKCGFRMPNTWKWPEMNIYLDLNLAAFQCIDGYGCNLKIFFFFFLLKNILKNFERVNWTQSCNTRHSNKGNYVLPKIRTETGKKSIVYWGPKISQEVPPDIKSKPLLLFKKIWQSFNSPLYKQMMPAIHGFTV